MWESLAGCGSAKVVELLCFTCQAERVHEPFQRLGFKRGNLHPLLVLRRTSTKHFFSKLPLLPPWLQRGPLCCWTVSAKGWQVDKFGHLSWHADKNNASPNNKWRLGYIY